MAIRDWSGKKLRRFWINCWVLSGLSVLLLWILPVAQAWHSLGLLMTLAVIAYLLMAVAVVCFVAPLIAIWRWARGRARCDSATATES